MRKSELEQIDAAWKKLEPLLEDQPGIRQLIFNKRVFAIAASIMIVAVTALIFFRTSNQTVVYTTGYGQTSKVILPDSSVVFLNGNSSLSFKQEHFSSGDRKVNLHGEAHFSVVHTKKSEKFRVHVGGLSIEVLGTEFNVSRRQAETRVVLSSGKIKLNIDKIDASETESIMMKPGDLVDYDSKRGSYFKKVVDPGVYTSWKSQRLLFDDTELKDVIKGMQETYGLKIKATDPELLQRRVSGSAPSKNLDMLIKGLSQIFDIKLTLKGDSLIVENKPNSN